MIFSDGDSGWHIGSGLWMIEHRQIAGSDPFSYTAAGNRWPAHEWLGSLILGVAYRLLGFSGVSLVVISSISALFLIVSREIGRWGGPVQLATSLFLLVLVLPPFILARPVVLAWPVLAYWLVILMRARDEDRVPALGYAVVMLLWANLHASFVVGLGLVGAFALEALLASRDRLRTFLQWAAFGSLCLLATFINPQGAGAVLLPLASVGSDNIHLIVEFAPTVVAAMKGFEAALLFTIGLCLWKGPRVPPFRILLILGMLHLALAHQRHQSVLAIIAVLLLSRPIAESLGARGPGRRLQHAPGRLRPLSAAACALFLLVMVIRGLLPMAAPNNVHFPSAAIAAIPAELRQRPTLNAYSFGGPLILAGIRPFMDGRTEVYGEEFFLNFRDIARGDAGKFADAWRRWRFEWTILSPKNEDLLRLLDRSREWRRIYADKYAVIHVRRDVPLARDGRAPMAED